ncbi:HNH endonuclease [uncultured Rhodoblastus sp.]|uniref:HNH endonuclease n=1 Tax=uncultured Rhodoblastus sp. TaxID=543037 RepID=UPI0025EBB11E|nr:HNH endonuclease [uncultured Rhodoblastus sp.]
MKKQIQLLKRLHAPDELVRSFEEICNINEQLDRDSRSNVSKLLEITCRKFGFSDVLDEGWFFRPDSLSGCHKREDGAVVGHEPEASTVEQAYRRGYDQGYSECRRYVQEGKSIKAIELRENEIRNWRFRSVQRYKSMPGDTEKPQRNIFGGRSTLSLKIRWNVLQRDEYKCVVCGATAHDGAKLEVDHIHPVSKGGSDDIGNLRTLCQDCNSGKSDST